MANRMFYYFSGDSSHFTSQAAPKAEYATAAVTQMLGNSDALRGGPAGHEL
jgi:hypothetical protein